jgi:hypothetical protein
LSPRGEGYLRRDTRSRRPPRDFCASVARTRRHASVGDGTRCTQVETGWVVAPSDRAWPLGLALAVVAGPIGGPPGIRTQNLRIKRREQGACANTWLAWIVLPARPVGCCRPVPLPSTSAVSSGAPSLPIIAGRVRAAAAPFRVSSARGLRRVWRCAAARAATNLMDTDQATRPFQVARRRIRGNEAGRSADP